MSEANPNQDLLTALAIGDLTPVAEAVSKETTTPNNHLEAWLGAWIEAQDKATNGGWMSELEQTPNLAAWLAEQYDQAQEPSEDESDLEGEIEGDEGEVE